MALSSFTPQRRAPYCRLVPYRTVTPVTKTLTTAGGVVTLTAAEVLQGLIRVNCDDAQTLNFPTASALIAAMEGVEVGTTFDVDIINFGDTTLTMAVNTGVTQFTIGAIKAVLTLATLTSKRFTLRVTSLTVAGGTDAVELYGHGSIAAAVA